MAGLWNPTGIDGARIWTGHGVLIHNLVKIAALAAAHHDQYSRSSSGRSTVTIAVARCRTSAAAGAGFALRASRGV